MGAASPPESADEIAATGHLIASPPGLSLVLPENSEGAKLADIIRIIFGSIFTPGPDVFSQCALAIPFVILYEVGILSVRIFGRDKAGLLSAPRQSEDIAS